MKETIIEENDSVIEPPSAPSRIGMVSMFPDKLDWHLRGIEKLFWSYQFCLSPLLSGKLQIYILSNETFAGKRTKKYIAINKVCFTVI